MRRRGADLARRGSAKQLRSRRYPNRGELSYRMVVVKVLGKVAPTVPRVRLGWQLRNNDAVA